MSLNLRAVGLVSVPLLLCSGLWACGDGANERDVTSGSSEVDLYTHVTPSEQGVGGVSNSKEPRCDTIIASGFGKDVDEATRNAIAEGLRECAGSVIDSETQYRKQINISNGIASTVKNLDVRVSEYSSGIIRKVSTKKVSVSEGIYTVLISLSLANSDVNRFFGELVSSEIIVSKDTVSLIESNRRNRTQLGPLIENLVLAPIASGEAIRVSIGSPTEVVDRDLIRKLTKEGFSSHVAVSAQIQLSPVFFRQISELFGEIAVGSAALGEIGRSLSVERTGLVVGIGAFGFEQTLKAPGKPSAMPVSGFRRFYIDWARALGRRSIAGSPRYFLFDENNLGVCVELAKSRRLYDASNYKIIFDFLDRRDNVIHSESLSGRGNYASQKRLVGTREMRKGIALPFLVNSIDGKSVDVSNLDIYAPFLYDTSQGADSCFLALNEKNQFNVAFGVPDQIISQLHKVVAYVGK